MNRSGIKVRNTMELTSTDSKNLVLAGRFQVIKLKKIMFFFFFFFFFSKHQIKTCSITFTF
jgi:hypothetical protein